MGRFEMNLWHYKNLKKNYPYVNHLLFCIQGDEMLYKRIKIVGLH